MNYVAHNVYHTEYGKGKIAKIKDGVANVRFSNGVEKAFDFPIDFIDTILFVSESDVKAFNAEFGKYYAEYDEVLTKFSNLDCARYFTIDDFNKIADWSNCKSTSKKSKYVYTTTTGNRIECDSKSEIKILEYLENNDLVDAIGGQIVCLPYDTAYCENKEYYPDFFALTKAGHIIVFEVKALTAMSYHRNIAKYEALANYCEEHNYAYAMIDPDSDYMTYEELFEMPVQQGLIDLFKDIENLDQSIIYEKEDVDDWYDNDFSFLKKTDFYLQVHSMIIYENWYNKYKNGFMFCREPFKYY